MSRLIQRVVLVAGVALLPALSKGTDHNNIDDGRSLRFEDASSIAYRERTVDIGVSAAFPRHMSAVLGSRLEAKYGFALNMDASVSLAPTYLTDADQFDASDFEISFFHALRREISNGPALAYRLGLSVPTGRDSKGVDVHVRAIMTKALRQYDKIHFNVDANIKSSTDPGEREVTFGGILGYSVPIGYPRSFTQTLLGEFAVQQSDVEGQGIIGTVGIGLRKQIGVRSVADIGIESDVFITDDAVRVPLALTAGLSWGF